MPKPKKIDLVPVTAGSLGFKEPHTGNSKDEGVVERAAGDRVFSGHALSGKDDNHNTSVAKETLPPRERWVFILGPEIYWSLWKKPLGAPKSARRDL